MKIAKRIISIILSGITAFLCLSVMSSLYYNLPAREESETYSTNYVWKKNYWHARGTEGFAYGRTDANGFNNIDVVDDVGILIMGSSQMEAFNVKTEQNTTFLLNGLLEQSSKDIQAYNIGISAHDFVNCINNLANAVSEFEPSHYVVIETLAYKFDVSNMKSVVDGSFVRPPSKAGGLLGFLQKFSFLRLVYRQIDAYFDNQTEQSKTVLLNEMTEAERSDYEAAMNSLLEKAKKTMPDGCELIILLDKPLELDDLNQIKSYQEDEYYRIFQKACAEHGIILLDMYKAFSEFYHLNHQFPNGFSNTRVGEGHLNKYGHQLIASSLFEIIQ